MSQDQEGIEAAGMVMFLDDYLLNVGKVIDKARAALQTKDIADLREACEYVGNHLLSALDDALNVGMIENVQMILSHTSKGEGSVEVGRFPAAVTFVVRSPDGEG